MFIMEKINKLIEEKNFIEAEKELLKLNDEKNIEVLKLLGLCYVNLGKYKEGQAGFILPTVMII